MPSYEKALSEFRRVLKPGGHLALSFWASPEQAGFFKTVIGFAMGEEGLGLPQGCAQACTPDLHAHTALPIPTPAAQRTTPPASPAPPPTLPRASQTPRAAACWMRWQLRGLRS